MLLRSRVPAVARALSHDLASTSIAVLLLGLALGTATAAFSLLHATVRAALGAGPVTLSRLVLRDTFAIAALAAAVGLLLSVPVTNRIAALDVSHTGTDLPTLAIVVALLLFAAIVASPLPAVRAARIAPAMVLRQE
jgi:putative ABC transport system permease protein